MNVPQLIVGISSLLVGGKTLSDALRPDDEGASERIPHRAPAGKPRSRLGPARTKTFEVTSIQQRVGHITAMIRKGKTHPDVRSRTTDILTARCTDPRTGKDGWCITERDHDGEVRAIFDAVREHIRYTGDIYGIDLYSHPARTLEARADDCDGFTIVLGAMLQSVGYPVRLRIIRTRDADSWNHIFLLAGVPPRTPRKWVALDASVDRPAGWHPPRHLIAQMRDVVVS